MILRLSYSGSYRINPAKARNPAGSQAQHGAPIFAAFPCIIMADGATSVRPAIRLSEH
jgi:hypothetical protein